MSGELELQELANAVGAMAASTSLDSELWSWFGLRRKRRGRIFLRFVDPLLLAKEEFLQRELAILTLVKGTQSLLALIDSPVFAGAALAGALSLLIDGEPGNYQVWEGFGFPSREAAGSYFGEGVRVYLRVPSGGPEFIARMSRVVTPDVRALWLVAATRLISDVRSPFPHIAAGLRQLLSGRRVVGRVRADKLICDVAHQAMLEVPAYRNLQER